MDGVPAELGDHDDPVWLSVQSTAAWAASIGLDFDPMPHGPRSRWMQAMEAWAIATGRVRFYGGSSRPYPDWNQLRDAGLRPFGSARAIEERMAFAQRR